MTTDPINPVSEVTNEELDNAEALLEMFDAFVRGLVEERDRLLADNKMLVANGVELTRALDDSQRQREMIIQRLHKILELHQKTTESTETGEPEK